MIIDTLTVSALVLQPLVVGETIASGAISIPAAPYKPASAPISTGDNVLLVCPSKSSVTDAIKVPADSAGFPTPEQVVKCKSGVAAVGPAKHGSVPIELAS